ncbi:MAG: glycosyltransferase family 39 protein [Chloroflexi bacterium]|nr:glycosyltransferase family 39 protein [Chloroflexota bacterium]
MQPVIGRIIGHRSRAERTEVRATSLRRVPTPAVRSGHFSALVLGTGVGLIYLALLAPGIYSVDGNSMLAVASSLVTEGTFRVPPALGTLGRDGSSYSMWYPLLSILAVPFVAGGYALAGLVGLPAQYVVPACALVLSALLTAGTTAFVALLAPRLGGSRRGAWLAALAYALGTIALVFGRKFYAEPLLAFLTVAALYFAMGETRRDGGAAGVFAGLAVLAKPSGLLVGPILAAYLLLKRRSLPVALAPLLGTGVGAILYGVYNSFRFGSPLSVGHPGTFALAGVPEGIVGLLFSPWTGLLWYSPPVLVALAGLRRALPSKPLESLAIVAIFLGFLLVHSAWALLYGGLEWGARYLLPAVPGLLALAGLVEKPWRRWLAILTAVGLVANAPTLVAFYERYLVEVTEQGLSAHQVLWSPADAPLIQMWGTAARQIADAWTSDPRALLREAGTPEVRGQMLRIVTIWWWMLPAAGLPRWPGIGLSIFLVGAGAWLVRKALP